MWRYHQSKELFEHFALRHHIEVKHYHCDHGIFAGTIKMGSPNQAWAILSDACHTNPFTTKSVWPFPLWQASEIDCTIPSKQANIKSPLEIFTQYQIFLRNVYWGGRATKNQSFPSFWLIPHLCLEQHTTTGGNV
jgi:hypothetical protein